MNAFLQSLVDRFGHTLATLLVAVVAIGAWKLGAPAEYTGPLGLLLGGLVVQNARNKPPPSGPTAPAVGALVALLLATMLPGCSSFLHASDPTVESTIAKACSLLGDQRKAAVEDEAKRAGLSLADAEKAFQLACLARLMGAGAEHAGLVGVQRAGIVAGDAGAP